MTTTTAAQPDKEITLHAQGLCGICGIALADPTNSSWRGLVVHNGCFDQKAGRRRLRSPGRRIRGLVPAGKRVKPWLRKHYRTVKVRGRWETC